MTNHAPNIDWEKASSQAQDTEELKAQLRVFIVGVEAAMRELDGLIYGGNVITPEERAMNVPYEVILKTVKGILDDAKRLGCMRIRDTLSSLCTVARTGISRKGTNLAKSQYLRVCSEFTMLEKCKNSAKEEIEKGSTMKQNMCKKSDVSATSTMKD